VQHSSSQFQDFRTAAAVCSNRVQSRAVNPPVKNPLLSSGGNPVTYYDHFSCVLVINQLA
jgi:hypothetical protein